MSFRRLQTPAAQELEALRLLAGAIAHDLNNFLATLLASVSLARVYVDESPRLLEKLDSMEKAAMGARELANRLLQL